MMASSLMMTSSKENIFHVTGPLSGEFTSQRWIPLTKSSDAELWCFLWSAPEQRMSNQSRRRWIETPSRSSWRQCDADAYIRHPASTCFHIIHSISRATCLHRTHDRHPHYNDVIMGVMAFHITDVSIVYSTVCSGTENTKAPRHWSLWGEFTGHRWIPRTRGQ